LQAATSPRPEVEGSASSALVLQPQEVFVMVLVEGSLVIDRSREDVFNFVIDERNEPRYNAQMSGVRKLTDGPIGKGTRFRAEMTGRGSPVEMVTEFTDFDRPRLLALRTRMASMEVHGALSFEPAPTGTRMSWSWELEPHGVLRWAGPIVGHLGRRQEWRIWRGLKDLLEERDPRIPS
jgi:hypothetical protein